MERVPARDHRRETPAVSNARRLELPPSRTPAVSNARGWAFSRNLPHTRDPFWAMPLRAAWLYFDLSIVCYGSDITSISGSGVSELDGETMAIKRA